MSEVVDIESLIISGTANHLYHLYLPSCATCATLATVTIEPVLMETFLADITRLSEGRPWTTRDAFHWWSRGLLEMPTSVSLECGLATAKVSLGQLLRYRAEKVGDVRKVRAGVWTTRTREDAEAAIRHEVRCDDRARP